MRNYGLVLVALLGFCTWGCGSKSKKPSDLSVAATPTGEIKGQLRVVLSFSSPMVVADRVGKPDPTAPMAVTPPLAGEATWTDDKTLTFVPTTNLPVSTKFIVTVPAGTKSLGGQQLTEPVAFEMFTERLSATIDVVGSKDRATKDQIVKIAFNQDVVFDQVAQQCALAGGSQTRKLKLAPDANPGPAKTFSVQPDKDLVMDTEWKLTCKQGLKGVVGNLGLAADVVHVFKTHGPLKFVSLDPNGNDIVPDEHLRLALAFTNPLAPPYQLKITPAVPGFPARCHSLGNAPAGLSCGAQLDPLTTYTLTIDKTQKDIFGQTLDKPHTLTFRTTDGKPTISLESGYFVAELKRPVVPLWTRNVTKLDVTTVPITPANFHELQPLLQWWETKPTDFSKSRLLKPKTKQVAITGTKNKWGQQSLGAGAIAGELFGAAPGPGMYYVEVGSPEVQKGVYKDGGRQKVLVNFTDIGVVSKLSPSRGLVWATQLSTGKPLPNAQVSVRDAKGKVTFTGTTDAEGVAYLPGTAKLDGSTAAGGDEEEGGFDDEGGEGGGIRVYVASGADWTMVNPNRSGGLSPWSFNVSQDYDRAATRLRGFMHTDRGLYRPGDTVHVKGFARVTKLGEPLASPGAGKPVEVEVEGPQGRAIITTQTKTSPFGGFWFDLELPGDARLGDYMIRAKLEHGTFTREFSVEEYRAATFEVAGKVEQGLVLRRGNVKAKISANYLYGAPLRSGEAEVTVHARPRRVTFAQHAGFDFSDERKYERYYYGDSEDSQTLISSDAVTLDQSGNANVSINVSPDDVYSDSDLLIRANVTAPNNEVVGKTFTVPYFRSKRYFGIKSGDWFIDVKKPYKMQVTSVAPDGKVVDGNAKVTITRRDWNCVWEDWGYRGSYHCKDDNKKILEKTVAISGGRPADIEFTPESGGDYWVVVEGDTDKAEASAAAMQLYAWGDGGGSWRTDDTLSFDIVADKKEYKPGDTAKLILKTDLANATGLVTIERDGVIEKRLVTVTPQTKHVDVPITAAHAPNVYVSVALVQGRIGDGPRGKPRMRMGLVNLPVRPQDNALTITIETDKKDYRPGANVTATVKVVDAAGKPASAEVSITAADEGVLSLIGYETPNPIPTFYAPWGIAVSSATQLEYLRDIPAPNMERPASGGDAAGTLRSRFAATAVWTPNAVTNAAGVATVTFKAPDNLTAFRLMAVAADRTYRFGSGDKRFTVSKPLQLHQALPRFVNQGDTVKAGVVVHNETPGAGSATVKLLADDKITVAGGNERTVQLAKGARVPVLFDLTGAQLGTTALQFSVTMNGESDAVKFELPVQHPSPLRTHHVSHGATKNPVNLPLTLPPNAIAASAEVVVSVDPDGLAGLEDGLRDLVGYPYGCLEQTTSKVIPMLAARDLAETMAIDGLSGPKLDGFVKAGLAKIGRHQTAYGGFSLWPGSEPEQYYTAYALWGLHLAKQSGYAIDETRVEEALDYLRGDGKRPDKTTPYYDEHGDLGSQAFALYVRSMFKDKDAAPSATTLLANPALPIYGKAFAVRALAASVGAKDPAVVKAVAELAALASAAGKADELIKESKDLHYYMSSNLRTTAVVLHTLVELDPKNAAIKPLVRSIMKHRRSERWIDTQSNMYSLLALTSYARSVAGAAPSVTVELGTTKLFEGALAGKTRMRSASAVIPAGAALSITPRGEVHYNVEIRYRRTPESLKAESNGIELKREYLDEAGKPKASFTVGDVVIVRVTATHKDRVNHLMISEPLPAGFEPLNTKFATVAQPTTTTQQRQSWGTFRELRDSRVDFASEYRWNGTHVYEFVMRATTVGKFARPPTIGELMYQPNVNGQTAMDFIEVKAK